MKRFLFTPVCALFAMVSFTSCQKEDMNATDLARELTTELQKVVDYKTAQAAAPRVKVINQRYQDASVRLFALNETPLLQAAASTDQYVDAVQLLYKEVGRIRGSKPVTDYAGDVEGDQILMAIGQNRAAEPHSLPDADSLAAGQAYMKNDDNKSHETPGEVAEYYGSGDLQEALAYIAEPGKYPITHNDSEAPTPIPAPGGADEMMDEEEAGDEEPADDESADDSSDESADESGDDSSDSEEDETI